MIFALLLLAGRTFSCPAALEGHKFLRPSIYNGTPGSKEYELAPDDDSHGASVRQIWKLSDYREVNLFVRCRYADTEAVVVKDLPKPLQTCLFTWRNRGGQQPITDPVFACR
jgi:hypothetical protein